MWKYVFLFSCIGIILAVYLLWQQIFHPAFSFCTLSSSINCDAIVSGPVATTGGISTPLIGFVGYVCMILASLLKRKIMLLITVSLGLLFCLWIAYQEIFLFHVICPVCILCEIDMLAIFILALFLQKGGI